MAITNAHWLYAPDFNSPFTETLQWNTDIMVSKTGVEQRMALRPNPRRTYEFDILVGGRVRSTLMNQLGRNHADLWLIPEWQNVLVLENPIAAGSNRIEQSDLLDVLTDQERAVLLVGDDPLDVEVAQLNAATSTDVTNKFQFFRDWPAGTLIYPLQLGRLTDPVGLRKQNSGASKATVRFDLQPLVKVAAERREKSILTETYRDFPLITQAPDDVSELDQSYVQFLSTLDNGTANAVVVDDAGELFTINAYHWVLNGREEYRKFLVLLMEIRGRQRPMWLPTFMDDFRCVQAYDSNTTDLWVEDCGYTVSGGPRGDHKHIMIETIYGDQHVREILRGRQRTEDIEILTLDSPLPADLAINDILRISYVFLVRLNSDDVVISHPTDTAGRSEIKLVLRSAPDLRKVP